jgi:hypothetical protein
LYCSRLTCLVIVLHEVRFHRIRRLHFGGCTTAQPHCRRIEVWVLRFWRTIWELEVLRQVQTWVVKSATRKFLIQFTRVVEISVMIVQAGREVDVQELGCSFKALEGDFSARPLHLSLRSNLSTTPQLLCVTQADTHNWGN